MKLLKKQEVDKARQLDRQREIDEGKKLATRVDNLRELAAIEEKNLTDFRTKTLKATMAEVNSLLEQKSALVGDIHILEEQRKVLLIPLDKKWEEVNRAQTICNDWETNLRETEENVTQRERQVTNLEIELVIEKGRVEDERERSRSLVASSGKMYEEARETLADARAKAQVLTTEAEHRLREASLKEEGALAKERDVEILRQDTLQKIRVLENQQKLIADKYKTLERTEKRLHGKRTKR